VLLNSRVTRVLLEAVEEGGTPTSSVLEPLGLTPAEVLDPSARLEWATVARVIDQVGVLFGGDAERLRAVGAKIIKTPSYEPVRRIARTALSPRALYEIGNRWIAPLGFPHLPLTGRFPGPRRMVLHGEIPASYVPCRTLFHIFEGSVIAIPTLIGLPPSTIVESRVTPRTIDLVVELPADQSVRERARRGFRALFGVSGAVSVLEEQRLEMADNIAALRRGREEIRALLDRLPDLVVVHVGDRIVWANPAFVAALEIGGLEGAAGMSLVDLAAPRSRELLAERVRSTRAARSDASLAEVVLLSNRHGKEVTVEIAPEQAVVFDGVPASLLVGRDVTERAAMQQRLIVADRLASVGLLAAGVAHEVNNPLAYILSNIEIAEKEIGAAGRPEVAREALSVALEGVDRIRGIVRDLLMLSRGEGSSAELVDVRTVATSTLKLAAREIERTARLVQDFRPTSLVRASESRISQVLLNLVGNALEAMRGGRREDNLLVVRISRADDGRVSIEVSDTGRGIALGDLPRVFEPFFTTKAAGEGTGLGLAIAQRLVVEMGGEIVVTSEIGVGTTFRVLLPAVLRDAPAPRPEIRRAPA
jgi:PAS domain S-box-containing protein